MPRAGDASMRATTFSYMDADGDGIVRVAQCGVRFQAKSILAPGGELVVTTAHLRNFGVASAHLSIEDDRTVQTHVYRDRACRERRISGASKPFSLSFGRSIMIPSGAVLTFTDSMRVRDIVGLAQTRETYFFVAVVGLDGRRVEVPSGSLVLP